MSDNTGTGIPEGPKKGESDGFFAAVVLIVTAVTVVLSVLYFWRNKKLLGLGDDGFKGNSFNPPPERALYIEGREKLDPSNPADLEELKKLLMRRAIRAIPILLNLQNEGHSIERLYKRGMLTDDMHFKVKELKGFVDQEFQDVQSEAEDLVEGWGANIWPQAMQFHQMIQKQTEERNEEQLKAEEQKKKAAQDKKKEKEKAKKQQSQPAVAPEPIVIVDPEVLKAQEAERIAQQLLEEEEREKNPKKGKGSKKA